MAIGIVVLHVYLAVRMVYCDEAAEEGSSMNVHQPTTFAHKNLTLEGVSVFWNEFSEASRVSMKSSPTHSVSFTITCVRAFSYLPISEKNVLLIRPSVSYLFIYSP